MDIDEQKNDEEIIQANVFSLNIKDSEDQKFNNLNLPENMKIVEFKQGLNETSFIIQSLKLHFIFYNLSEEELTQVANKMFYCEAQSGTYLFRQGDQAQCFFIIHRGSMGVTVDDIPKRELRAGEGFGELALLYTSPRSASVKCFENCFLFGIDRVSFRRAVEDKILQEYEENRKFLENVRFFYDLTNEQKDAIASILKTLKFYRQQMVVTEGDPGSSFYIIKDGTAMVTKNGKEMKKLHKGDTFGEQSLFYNTMRQMSVMAEDDVTCLVVGRDALTKLLGDQIHIVTFRNLLKWAFEKNALLQKLTKTQIEKTINQLKLTLYRAGDIIMKKGTSVQQKIIVVVEGCVKKNKSGIVIATKGQVWGEEYFLIINKNKLLDDDIVMETDGVLAEMSHENFIDSIGGFLEEVIKKNEKSQDKKLKSQIKQNNYQSIKKSDLIFIKQLAVGQFGPVYLVKAKSNQQLFTLKTYNKSDIKSYQLERFFETEKQILESLQSPFIIKFYRTFQDDYDLFLLLEFVNGKELYDVIRDIGLLSSYDSQLYIASMILIVESFYKSKIIHRDIKPENFMVDSKGYLKLIDVGIAKPFSSKSELNRTFTIIGTPYYMAPEVICGKGYNNLVDLWSIGICLFEFLCGYVPFGEDAEDPYEIYEQIIKNDIIYPQYFKEKKAKKLIEQLLSRIPEVRLGNSFANLKGHQWFENFDWDKLIDQDIPNRYIPNQDQLITNVDIKQADQQYRMVDEEIKHEQQSRQTLEKIVFDGPLNDF
ncbi:unnamed protein product (macronuclear) [Paramecium tetraurelia]|uniref:cGMP-dependent protein kinase n=1 Tax=Paramecium tetraurelia TaxID=5888 RepID=A0CAU2_PARTE|nr:uncharacterized protein GSPATT00036690001 [Paramecium tetraurelia]CAK67909.1 unnamed protein product [Paramecium tetraurelia]|eukprot:XP_001435306.1 hypothetical protein (macronuclear) [Paramecium tetraurelia strain d4-2]